MKNPLYTPTLGIHFVQVWIIRRNSVFSETASDNPVAISVIGGDTWSISYIHPYLQTLFTGLNEIHP